MTAVRFSSRWPKGHVANLTRAYLAGCPHASIAEIRRHISTLERRPVTDQAVRQAIAKGPFRRVAAGVYALALEEGTAA